MSVRRVGTSIDTAIGYTLATGRLFVGFPKFHEYAESLLARPIMTHEFADPRMWRELREAFEAFVLELAPMEWTE